MTAESHAAFIDRVRQSGIRIDREGRFIHEGQEVQHQGLRRALYRWLDRLPDGRHVLRLDAERFAYIDVDDTPLVVRAVRWRKDRALLSLSDGAREELDPATVTVEEDGAVRCLVRGGRLRARFSTSALATLSERIDGDSGRAVLTADPRRPRALAPPKKRPGRSTRRGQRGPRPNAR